MTRARTCVVFVVVATATFLVVQPGTLYHLPLLRWRAGDDVHPWPHVERHDYALRLTPPGGFTMAATLELSDVRSDRVVLMLNRDLDVRAARATTSGGEQPVPVGVTHGLPLFAPFHSEGRAVHVRLPAAPPDGRLTLALDVEGEAAHGAGGPDWRGILFIDEREARMCEQTIFYPQVPTAVHGPAIERAPYRILVDVPETWQVYVPAAPLPPDDPRLAPLARRLGAAPPGTRRWVFGTGQPAHVSILAGVRQRTERVVDDTTFVVLMRDEHAALAEPFVDAAARVFADMAARFGDPGATQLGIVEIACRPSSSYNWFSQGVIAIDRHALSDVIPVDTLAHEIGHFWWGQRVSVDGPGERVVTEGLAEASAWWFLLDSGDPALVERGRRALARARRTFARLLDEGDDAPLAAVDFETPRYRDLAYEKGPLLWHALATTLGAARWQDVLVDFAARAAGRPARLDDLRAALEDEVSRSVPLPWLDHAGHVEVDLAAVDASADQAVVTLRARTRGGMPPRALVALELLTDRGRRRVTAGVDGGTTRVALPLEEGESPRVVTLDPQDGWPTPIRSRRVLAGPRLVSSDPPLGDVVPYGLERLTLTFDEPLAPLTAEAFALGAAEPPQGVHRVSVHGLAVEDGGRRWRFTFEPLGVEREYVLDLSHLTDAFGGPPRPPALRWRTSTSDDQTPPRLVAAYPPDDATEVPVDLQRIVLTFDEPMRESIGFMKSDVRALEGEGLRFPGIDPAWSRDRRRLVLALPDGLEPGTRYALPLRGARFADLSHNPLADVDYRITTAER